MPNPSSSRWRYWLRFHLPNVLYLLILASLAAGSYWWVKHDNKKIKPVKEKHPDLVDAFTLGMKINRTGKDDKVAYVITSTEFTHFGDKDSQATNVTLTATPVGQPVTVVHANTGKWSDQAHTIDLEGQVVMDRVKTPDAVPMHLTTEKITVDLYNNTAVSDQPFVLTQGADKITGQRFTYDYASRNISIGGQKGDRVKAVLNNVKSNAIVKK